MSDTTPILSLPLIQGSQAQKHVTHNEALRILDVAVQLSVADRTRTVPPATPAVGARHIVAAGATGVWAGQAGRIALYTADGWEFVQPGTGWQAYVAADGAIAFFDGTVWALPATGGSGPVNPATLGVNAVPDVTNRLSVASPAALFSHEGAGHQVKVNKAASADTASLLFQTGFSGRAEMGTIGGDAFAIKVSANGAAFVDAFRASGGTGHVSLPGGVLSNGFALRDAGDPTRAAQFVVSGISTATMRSFTLPDLSGEVAVLAGTQTFTGAKTFSGGLTASGAFTAAGAAATLGTATTAATYGVGTGATQSGATKAVQIGTGGLAGSTTTVTIGSAVAGTLGSVAVHAPSVMFGPTVTAVAMESARVTASSLGLGAIPTALRRLSVSAEETQFSHDGLDHRVRINKAGLAETASLQFLSGLVARAEIGLLASNGLEVRVSPDGVAWSTALSAAPASGQVTLAAPVVLGGQTVDPVAPANGTVWHDQLAGVVKARLGGMTRILPLGSEVAYLQPVAGDHLLTVTGAGGGGTTTTAGTTGRIEIFPYVARADSAINQFSINVTTAVAAALCKIVVYSADAFGRPDALLVETADLNVATTGIKTVAVSMNWVQGAIYWLGVRHSLTSTLSAWPLTATPDINGGVPSTAARKVLRRTVTYASAAPASWGFLSAEISNAPAPAIWARVG